MILWIQEVMHKLDRKKADILFSRHALNDRNLTNEDIDFALKTARRGKISKTKCTKSKQRICFKNYFKTKRKTYFVIAEYYPDFIKIITLFKKKGKY